MIDPIRLPCRHVFERAPLIRDVMLTRQCPRCHNEVDPETLRYRVTHLKKGAQFLASMAIMASCFRGHFMYTYLHLLAGYFLCGNSRLPFQSTELTHFTVTDNLGAIAYGIGSALLLAGIIAEEDYYTAGLILVDLSTIFLAAQHMAENLVLWVGGDR